MPKPSKTQPAPSNAQKQASVATATASGKQSNAVPPAVLTSAERRAALQAELEKIQSNIAELQRYETRLIKELDAIIEAEPEQESNQHALMAAIQSSRAARAAQHEAYQEFRDVIGSAPRSPLAPIDQVLRNRRRPVIAK